jgi:hypothetical protein
MRIPLSPPGHACRSDAPLRASRAGAIPPAQSAQADFAPFQRRIHSLLGPAPAGNPRSPGESRARIGAGRAGAA